MAKIQIKSEKLTLFEEYFRFMEQFDSTGEIPEGFGMMDLYIIDD